MARSRKSSKLRCGICDTTDFMASNISARCTSFPFVHMVDCTTGDLTGDMIGDVVATEWSSATGGNCADVDAPGIVHCMFTGLKQILLFLLKASKFL